MKKFLITYHSPAESREQMAATATPEQQEAGMQAWMSWASKVGDKLVDLGSPLTNAQQLSLSGSDSGNQNVGGYSIIQASDIEEVKSLLDGHPHIGEWNPEATIEIHEFMPIPGMN